MAGLILASFTGFLSTAAFGQGTAPMNPKFIEWQKRRADEVARKSQESETGANAQKRAAPKQAAAPADEDLGMGLVPTLVDMDYLADLNSGVVRAPVGGFPSSYDLRQQGRLTSIRDQNPYGTCWAHATMASLESWILGNEGVETDFSENNLANLHGWDWGFDDGGNATIATAYLARWGGPVDESSDPYPDWGGSTVKSPVRHIQRVFWIPGKSAPLDNDAIKQAIMERGAVYVSYYHTSSYYKSSTASFYYPGSCNGNHAVAIVGWNDNYSASNFSTKPAGNGAYLVRNSWGTGWGNSGYFWVSYYDGIFARSTMYSFANAEPTDNYGKIYQYDPLGAVSHFSTPYCANMFTATGADKIAAVGFYALAPKTAYSLSIYMGCQSGKPTSGTCAISQSGTIDEAGFVTLPLSKSVAVASGSRFSVVLNLSTPGYGYPSAFEYAYTGITSGANASAGQSFYSFNGTSWTDLTSWNGTANFCIKAYTESASVVVSLASVAVSGPASVESGKAGKYVCTAKYSDNSEKTVSATWSVVSGSEHAAISGDGTLTAGKTSLDRTVVIRASYAEGGVTKSDDWQLTVTAGPPAIPTELSATSGTETRAVRLTWAAVTGAESYSVYRSATSSPGNALYLGISESAKYSDSDAVPGVDYWYFVKAKNSSGTSGFSEGARGWRALAAPGNVSAGDGASVDFVKVTWDAVEGASCYRVFRADSFDGAATPLTGWISATEFTDSTAEPGTVYWYSVVAATDSAGTRPSAAGIPDDGFRAVPVIPAAIAIEGDGAIPSGGTASYAAFALYSDGSRGESPLSPAWEVSAGTVSRTGEVTAPTVSANADIVISAQTTLEGVAISGTKTVAVTATAPGTPSNFRLVSATAAGVSLAWDAVPDASRYVVSRGASGVMADFTTAEATFTDTSATPGVAYSYHVAAENAAGRGPQSAAVEATIPLAAPTGVKATSDRTDGVRVTWGSVPGATHYRVARATAATGEKTELGAWTADTAYLDMPPAADTAYWYFVKAATDSFGSNPGAWSEGIEGRMKSARTLLSLSVSGPDRVASGGDAVYSCKALWSDGAEESVSPAWSVSPASAGSIDANGRFGAASVSSDVGATVTATYGGKTGTASVTVLAPAAATAEITSVTAAQRWPFSSLVDIDYTLATTPADIKAFVSLSVYDEDHGKNILATTVSGDGANGVAVSSGSHRLTWDIGADHPGFHAKHIVVSMSAVSKTTEDAEYVVIDISNGPDATSYPVTILDTQPVGGFNADEYKTTKIVLKRIEPGTFIMGSPSDEVGRNADYETQHEVTITKPFFAGLFEVTQKQWELVMGTKPSYFSNPNCYDIRPVEQVSYAMIRGSENGFLWPFSDEVDEASFIGRLRAKAAGFRWDLPTEAQWEYACRAGTTTALNIGIDLSSVDECTEFPGRYAYNCYPYNGNPTWWNNAMNNQGTQYVGYGRPNNWGLYDMHGNVCEWCLDWGKEDLGPEPATDPTGPASGNYCVARGGSWFSKAYGCRSAFRADNSYARNDGDFRRGFRLFAGEKAVLAFIAPVVTATGYATGGKRVDLSWNAVEGATQYRVLRSISGDISSATTLATVTGSSYTDSSVQLLTTYTYWVVAARGGLSAISDSVEAKVTINLMPLRSLLSGLDIRPDDGILSDEEMTIAFNNPSIGGGIDGNSQEISADELDILTRIQALNQNKDLISAVMRGEYDGIADSTMDELVAVSKKVRDVKDGYSFAPGGVAASEGNGGLSARVTLSWTAPNPPGDTVSRYEIYRAATTNGAETLVAMVTTTSWTDTDVSYRQPYWYRVKAVYASQSGAYSLQAKGYWGDWCFPGTTGIVNLMPLKSMLNVLDAVDVDRVISDEEMTIAFNNPSIGDIDGNPKTISSDELDILNRIQTLNQNKDLISAVMRGDYTYAGMTYANMVELQAISDKISKIKKT